MGDLTVPQNFELYLAEAPIMPPVTHVQLGGGHPGKSAFRLAGGVQVIAKPSDTVPMGLQMVHYEVAAWQTVKALEWTDMMGATVLRELESYATGATGVVSSVQVMLPATSMQLTTTNC